MASSSSVQRESGWSLRTYIVAIVLGGAIVPLLLLGLWLTSSGVRSGEALLNDQLVESSKRFAEAIDARWEYREADLQLLTTNSAVERVLTSRPIAPADSQYLNSIFASVAPSIENVTYSDKDGHVRWSSTRGRVASAPQPASFGSSTRLLDVQRPIVGSDNVRRGTMSASVRLSGFLPSDSLRALVPGSLVAIRDLSTGAALAPLSQLEAFPSAGRLTLNGTRWLATTRRTAGPPLEIAVLAPTPPYVAPFQKAARRSVLSLFIVTLLTLVLTVLLATKLVASLQSLAGASANIARGQLGDRVYPRGPTEVRRLAGAFNAMAESLSRTLAELSQQSALAAVGEFATSLSHDVRNALTSVKLDLQRAVKRPPGDPVHAELVARALHNVSRLDSSVSGALRVARSARQHKSLLDLRDVLIAAKATTAGAFAAVPATLDLAMSEERVLTSGDSMALEQLFTNLLFNAAQALRPGGCARVVVVRDETHVVVSVEDDGVGMTEEQRTRVLQPYYSTKPFGTGIGLAIASQIARSHGGDLTISSTPDRGTTVRVRLAGPFLNSERGVGA